jgi:hypothetical protein
MLAAPKEHSAVPTKAIVWAIIAALILGLGLAGSMLALKRAQKLVARQKQQHADGTPPTQTNSPVTPLDLATQAGFQVSTINFEKTQGSSLIYAVGTLNNMTARQRFGVKVELDLLDASGQKIGTATDYHQVMEPNSQWQFKALVVASKAALAKLAAVKEDQ